MKVKINKDGKVSFKPIKLEIVFETPEEISKFYCIMNHSAICDAASPHLKLTDIRAEIHKAGNESLFDYQEFFSQFKEDIKTYFDRC